MKINVCVCKGKILPIISLKAADKLMLQVKKHMQKNCDIA